MTREQRGSLSALVPSGRVRFDEPMAGHGAFGAGGPAEAFVVAEEVGELRAVIAWAMEHGVDYRFWGGGSRTLVRDGGVRGVVVALGGAFSAVAVDRLSGDEVFVSAGAAARLEALAGWCAKQGLAGAESCAGRRGTIGGHLMAPDGAGDPLCDRVEEITVVDREGRELTMRRTALRREGGRLRLPRTMAIVRALFRFGRGGVDDASPPSPERSFENVFASAGRTPAEVLIEEAGVGGVRVGGARVLAAHPNVIVNEGHATARDAIVLMNLVRERVREQTGIALELKIEVIGNP